ncbi:methanesulfonate monooxygenase [Glaciimonas sp. CA11.2]|uniref:methanesulfonate monooxygenase n=1 Tax=Glaciimonas sp. CA11.2 TaxID=3048601 RepID=UPI002AB59A2C|nr:methanesulfonate monooxygenase [Glaciimonas sp. CA11.2]MDY7547703.1 methanesulfonate monooxygenase [Glaciimonas sp. CA11.2]MEB0161380.1 methanesulfonate monooxygenase [Glaciimonas sp. CA11.2]
MDSRTEITELIYKTCLRMDAKDFDGYLALCDTAFHYAITAFSPEIRKNMTWLEHDHAGMAMLFGNLPKHNSDHSLLSRHATVYTVEEQPSGETAKVTSALQVFRTTLDGGATELFAVGKMTDLVQLSAAGARLLDRNIHLETRMIGFGFHIPF